MTSGSADEVSAEARMLAAQARSRAAVLAAEAELDELAERASRARGPEQREALGALLRRAHAKAQDVSRLMGELAALTGDGGGAGV